MRLEPTSHTRRRGGDTQRKICMKNGIIKDNRNEDNSKFTRGNPNESASEANKKYTTSKRLIVPFYKSRFNA
jgi:hypothetical protein